MKMNDLVGKTETIEFKLNGDKISAFEGETIIQAAARHGVDIPHLCYKEGYRPDGNCRACMVEIKGERVLAPSCCRAPAQGMEVQSNNARALASQKMVVELLMNDVTVSEDLKPGANELTYWADKLGVKKGRFPAREGWKQDVSHPAMDVNLDACIQCTRCVRACREEQVNDVIGYAFRGLDSKIVFDMDDPMGEST
ncbi:MAG TPA: 2Fe-2S iron-sulfur cluster-binding protein, partial [Usitatibacter sp.]|nr:2Fe-2S iron-sulfur cluster-binding protein [Usitatibacter sp.]